MVGEDDKVPSRNLGVEMPQGLLDGVCLSPECRPSHLVRLEMTAPKPEWTTFRRETYAVQQALRHFHAEISGRHLVIFSDHKPFVQAFASERPPQHDQIAYNQLMEIAQWTSDVRHLPGKLNWVADSLSRPDKW